MRFLASLVLVALTGCASTPGSSSSSAGPGSSTPAESGSPVPSGDLPASGDADLVGTLGGDPTLEGGCAWLTDDAGQQWEVLWPAGYAIQFRGEHTLLVRDGQDSVAMTGDRIGVDGAEATGMASICQVGRLFEASDLVFVEPAGTD
jgi:hypothetical protein